MLSVATCCETEVFQLFLFLVCRTLWVRDWTWDLVHAKQALYHWATSPFYCFFSTLFLCLFFVHGLLPPPSCYSPSVPDSHTKIPYVESVMLHTSVFNRLFWWIGSIYNKFINAEEEKRVYLCGVDFGRIGNKMEQDSPEEARLWLCHWHSATVVFPHFCDFWNVEQSLLRWARERGFGDSVYLKCRCVWR